MAFFEKYQLFFYTLIVISIAGFLHWILTQSIQRVINRLDDRGHETTKVRFIKNSLGFIIYSIAIFLIIINIPKLKVIGTSLLAGAGILAAIIGFASQAAFSNIISGVFIIIFKPFQIDDTIELENSLKGMVVDITFRHTVIRDFENRRIVIPNTKIADAVIINSSLDELSIRKKINFSVSYESDVELAKKIIREVIESHPLCIDNRKEDITNNGVTDGPIVQVVMTSWEPSGVNLRAYVWTSSNANAFILECDVLDRIKKRFQSEGVVIPYPQMKIHK